MAASDWDAHYQNDVPPWETGQPSSELQRVVQQFGIRPCRAVELGCGSGFNAVWLAQNGFDVTAIDISRLAIEKAQGRAASENVPVTFVCADLLDLADEYAPFPFFFDRGCYHAVRRDNVQGYLRTLMRLTLPGSQGLILTGNAKEPHEKGQGPPVVAEEELRAELGQAFEIVRLHEFRFDSLDEHGIGFLGWSCLVRRRETTA